MRYHALAADYDGTLAHHGVIDEDTWAALRKLKESGRKLIMVTGRELDELLALLEHPEVFDRIVAENGALVYTPSTKQTRNLAPGPPAAFVAELQKRGVERISVGRVIVATWEPHQDTVLHVIHDQGLELQVIFNKGAVMILPSGVNKASGLAAALTDLRLSPHNVVGIGDAENDHALLSYCECGVAVANSLPALRHAADLVTKGPHGHGIAELVEHLLTDDLAVTNGRLKRHRVLLGKSDNKEISLDPYATCAMVCGTSGSGKSTLTTGLLERLNAGGYQFAIIDPEGDYATLDFAVVLGGPSRAPLVEEVLDVLADPSRNVVINMLGVAVDHRPEFCAHLLPALAELRSRTGRPHFLVIDEAHHMLPASWTPANEIPVRPHGTLYVTVHPGSVAPSIIGSIESVLAVGEHPERTLNELAQVAKVEMPSCPEIDRLEPGHAMYWKLGNDPIEVATEPPHGERTRHSRKYTEGNLGHERSFFFRGREGKLKLKAHNLHLFMHIAEGIDDDTWTYHLQCGDYSRWLRVEVKDVGLADAVAVVEKDKKLSPDESRARVRSAIEQRYTLPSDKASGLIDPPPPPPKRAQA
ncbi:MAG: HAD-IIB family hydrolase [Deltaproteobacteria bacterium]|nr:HAD-IIB family hydrolase [Deltaproteobacteria bacterium]